MSDLPKLCYITVGVNWTEAKKIRRNKASVSNIVDGICTADSIAETVCYKLSALVYKCFI